MARKTANIEKGKDTVQESLAAELKSLIPRLDTEGLAFLVEQAKIHLYNMQVQALNAEALNKAAHTAAARTPGVSRSSRSPKSAGGDLRIDGTESGSSYYLRYGNDDVMFSRGEIDHLVKIVNGEGTDLEIRERLYRWFDRERRDIFAVVPIKDKFDDRLKALVALIKKNFKNWGGLKS